jgi:hypothetical protein
MPAYHRSSSEVERQLADFKSNFPEGIPEPPSGDFAAKLQYKSWRRHLKELEAELDRALETELAETQAFQALAPLRCHPGIPAVSREDAFPRPHVRDSVLAALARGNVLLEGPRRIGKTSLLLELAQESSSHKAVFISCDAISSPVEWWSRITECLDETRSERASWPPTLPTGTWAHKAKFFVDKLLHLRVPRYFLLDEFPLFLENANKATDPDEWVDAMDSFRASRAALAHSPHRFLLCGSTSLQHTIRPLNMGAFFGDFSSVSFPIFSRAEGIRMTFSLGLGHGINFNYGVLKNLISKVGHVSPFYLQVFVQELINRKIASPTDADVDDAYHWLTSSPMSYLFSIVPELERHLRTREEQSLAMKLLCHVAQADDGPLEENTINCIESGFAQWESSPHEWVMHETEHGHVLDALQQEGYLVTETEPGGRKGYRFVSSMLQEFWKRVVV